MSEGKEIYSAGPSITDKEVQYAAEAARHGWYSRYSEWVDRFERAFADYIGLEYALATPHGTSAMHLAMCALRLGKGDEVIVPDITWVATANVVSYVGAKPICVDVTPETWTMDPAALKSAITPRTKAIMPVHLYGHPANMDAVNEIAVEHGLKVIEDACPAVGSLYKGKRAGSLGDIGCFSFQGSKLLAVGEGGMLVTDNRGYFERAKLLSEHARDDSLKTFWCGEIGFQYAMPNIVAALGLAQLERVDELIEMKRRIFGWYSKRLEGIEGLALLREREDSFSNCSYPSIILDDTSPVTRDELRAKLKARNIATRPAFPRISEFPHLANAHTPVAERVERCGLNLPCAFNLTEEDTDYVCKTILKILKGTD